MADKPTSFSELSVAELRRSAIEDFAVEIGEKDNRQMVMAALAESGVAWADYVAQHPEVAPEEKKEDNVISVAPTRPETLSVGPVEDEEQQIVVQEPMKPQANATYLIKMTRENPLYEVRGHRFTQEHPYALVTPEDAQFILSREDGFRQAFPNELEEFYS